jgi:hypothetical protein
MMTDILIKPRDITRQCDFLISKGKEIVSFNTITLLLLRNRLTDYFMTLSDYCKFYNEMKIYFSNNKISNDMINERINNLPDIKFKDFELADTNYKSAITYFFYAVLYPFSIFWSIKKYNYIRLTRQKIIIATDIFSTIDFLFKIQFQ